MSKNTNCLEGVRCPKCGHEADFTIEAIVTLHVTDCGSSDEGGDHFWDDTSLCTCCGCGHEAQLGVFSTEEAM